MTDEYFVSNIAFERIVNLLSEGYDVRLRHAFTNEIEIRISKDDTYAVHYVSIEKLKQVKIDYMLYTINHMIDMIDKGLGRSKF